MAVAEGTGQRTRLLAATFAACADPEALAAEAAQRRAVVVKPAAGALLLVTTSIADAVALAVQAARGGGRAGVAAGDVTVERAAGGVDAFGLAVITSKRLLDVADPGAALVPADLVEGLCDAGGLELVPAGRRELKGLPSPVDVLAVAGTGPPSGNAALTALLVTDWVDSTATMAALGTTAADELRRRHFELLRNGVAARRGREVINTGDGLVASFPALGDATACALALHRAFARSGTSMQIRAAVSAADVIDPSDRPPAVVELERIGDGCPAGAVATTRTAAALLDLDPGFEVVRDCDGPDLVRGTARTVSPLPAAIANAPSGALVAREGELDRLDRALERAAAGTGGLVLITGDAGIGKSTLSRAFARRAHAAGHSVLFGRCDPEAVVPYQPFVEALREHVASADIDLLADVADGSSPELLTMIPALGERLPHLTAGPGTPDRLRLFAGVTALLRGLAEDRPLLLLVEDLHWADDATLLLLRHVIRDLGDARVLLMVATREPAPGSPVAGALEAAGRELPTERLELEGLDGPALFDWLATRDRGGEPSLALADELAGRTGGNPLFAEELVRHLESAGIPLTAAALRAASLPRGLEDAMLARVTAAGPELRRVLSGGALLGRTFGFELLAEVVRLDEDDVADLLDDAVAAGLVRELGAGRFRFHHALAREALYAAMTDTRRSRLHARAADVLTGRAGSELAEVAYHCARAGTPEHLARAVDVGRKAAAEALGALAYEEAARRFEVALQAHDRLGGDAATRAELLVDLAGAQRAAGERDAARASAVQAAEAARAASRPDLLAAAALWSEGEWLTPGVGDPQTADLLEEAARSVDPNDLRLRARVLAAQAVHRADGALRSEAAGVTEAALALARRSGDPAVVAWALNARQLALRGGPADPAAAAVVDEMLDLARSRSDRDFEAVARHWRAADLMGAGDLEGASREIEAFDALATLLRRPLLRSQADKFRVAEALWRDELDAAEALIERARRSSMAAQRTGGYQQHRYQRCLALGYSGRIAEAAELSGEAMRLYPEISAWGLIHGYWSARTGDVETGTAQLERFCTPAGVLLRDDVFYTASLAHLALLAARLGDPVRSGVALAALAPYAGTHLVIASGAVYAGPAELYTSGLRRAAGDAEGAVRDAGAAETAAATAGSALFLRLAREQRAALAQLA